MKELTIQYAQVGQFRDLNMIGGEIRFLYEEGTKTELSYAIKIGRRLKEAKELCEHGQWADWLKENVPFSQSKANKLMAVYEKFGANQESFFGEANSETFTNLGLSQAFLLLSVPDEEREEFVKENNVEDMTAAELRKAIKERDEAVKAKEAAEAEAGKLRASNTELNDKANRATAAEANASKYRAEKAAAEEKAAVAERKEKAAKEELEKLKANPEIPEEKLKEISEAAEKTAKEEAAKVITEAEKRLAATADELKAAQSQLKMSNPDVAEFKIYFVQFQESFNRVLGMLKKIKGNDAETAEKLKSAIFAAINDFNLKMPED